MPPPGNAAQEGADPGVSHPARTGDHPHLHRFTNRGRPGQCQPPAGHDDHAENPGHDRQRSGRAHSGPDCRRAVLGFHSSGSHRSVRPAASCTPVRAGNAQPARGNPFSAGHWEGPPMITVQDRRVLHSNQVQPVLALFRERYQPAAALRGLHFVEQQVSPPLALQSDPVTLWLRWQVHDVGAWWAMRAQSGVPEVAAFWAEIDGLVQSRERVCLQATEAMAAAPHSLQTWQIQTRGHRETAQLALREGLTEAAIEELEATLRMAGEQLPGLETAELGRHLASRSLTLTPAALPAKTGATAMTGPGELQAPHRLT